MFSKSDGGLPNIRCGLNRWANNPSAAESFFDSAAKCTAESWKYALSYVGLPFNYPDIKYPSGSSWSSPCGGVSQGSAAAFYCPTNQTLYMPYEGLQVKDFGNRPGVYLAVFAHEYGHHIQQITGIMPAMNEKRYDAGADSAEGLEYSRRLELQAQCFSGMFLGSTVDRGGDVNRAMYNDAWRTQQRGDHGKGPRDHGSDAHSSGWWQTGALKNRNVQCNTWASPSGDVS
ncbi:neutral zinc metallopeptidase [Amycolatopsis sp. NPDC059657]|uniref:neutral zinc metallopeptidase n=1 Tax=Amycolatopsis sp. NPDC059657 TaxID=3346899 RepID=UPI003672B7F8